MKMSDYEKVTGRSPGMACSGGSCTPIAISFCQSQAVYVGQDVRQNAEKTTRAPTGSERLPEQTGSLIPLE